ncbi:MAG: Re/Si-specific NAD(P)(+) transhydrogenase subunit alpha [Opitutales bacterium]
MKSLFVPKERHPKETRAALTPEYTGKLVSLGLAVQVEPGLGARADYPDEAYTHAGATLASNRTAALGQADYIVRVCPPEVDEIASLKAGALHVSLLDPFNNRAALDAFATAGVNAVSLEMIPRTTLAQKMDVLSSQANLAGYAAVIVAADRLSKILPMMMTPAGTISPCKVFVIGVGVAGLQAIATAKRLGARVQAFDTRPIVEEQVKSLGAKFLKIDLGETGQTDQGYARELTPEQLAKQREGMQKACADADIVITTAKLFGRPAPKIVNAAMVEAMQPGSLIVDLAAATGGNVEGTVPDEETITANGVCIIGDTNLEGYFARNASDMYSSNGYNFIEHFWDSEGAAFAYNFDDEILRGCLITHDGAIVHEKFKA